MMVMIKFHETYISLDMKRGLARPTEDDPVIYFKMFLQGLLLVSNVSQLKIDRLVTKIGSKETFDDGLWEALRPRKICNHA
jgi:hypothetical protein